MSNSPSIPDRMQNLIARLIEVDRPRLQRLWLYVRNPMSPSAVDESDSGSHRPYRQGQEWGLPSRITGVRSGATSSQVLNDVRRKEVVIENDIGWRVDTMVDYLFGKPIVLNSAASDPNRRVVIERLLRQIVAVNGGLVFLQQLALLGAVSGFVDVLVKLQPGLNESNRPAPSFSAVQTLGQPSSESTDSSSNNNPNNELTPETTNLPDGSAPSSTKPASLTTNEPNPAASIDASRDAWLMRLADLVRFEIVDPTRALPALSATDYRVVEAYAQVYEIKKSADDSGFEPSGLDTTPRQGWMSKLLTRTRAVGQRAGKLLSSTETDVRIVDLVTPTTWARYENDRLVGQGSNSLGEIPLVHIQNIPVPNQYTGASDVEPLIPLQDELNTRLSDRANRITLQSFKMYLGKGIEHFTELPIEPGRMWATDNDQADVLEFGGDAGCPSEVRHLAEVREALDKASGVSPIAAGAIQNRIGNLTSAVALRITLMALLARTERKRLSYGAGLARLCELSLAWLDRAGLFKTSIEERRVEIHWPNPLPESEMEALQQAESKQRLGVPKETVLRELGY